MPCFAAQPAQGGGSARVESTPGSSPAAAAARNGFLQVPELPAQRGGAGAGMPWSDGGDGGHLERDARRRATERPLGERSVAAVPSVTAPSTTGPAAAPSPAPDDAQRQRLREQGERELEARRLRGGMAPLPEATPRIQPSAPPGLEMPRPPRIAIPAPGEPGGPPIALPTCGPAGCFDANGRPLGRSGSVLTTPEGRPCIQVGSAAAC